MEFASVLYIVKGALAVLAVAFSLVFCVTLLHRGVRLRRIGKQRTGERSAEARSRALHAWNETLVSPEFKRYRRIHYGAMLGFVTVIVVFSLIELVTTQLLPA